MARRRQLLVFDRFLARIGAVLGDAATLKGGLALECRIERARTTKDIDLRLTGAPYKILAQLQEVGRRDLGDFMTFEVGPDEDHPEIQADGMQYIGLRFRAEGKLAGKLYGQRFGVDIAFGDPILGEPQVILAEDVLAFAGIAPPTLRLYPIETHIAEKLHAYTMPRSRPSSRVKDLPDIALLATVQSLAIRVGDSLRGDGSRRPACMAHSRRRHQSGSNVSWPRARREPGCDLGARGLGLATSLNAFPPCSSSAKAPERHPWQGSSQRQGLARVPGLAPWAPSLPPSGLRLPGAVRRSGCRGRRGSVAGDGPASVERDLIFATRR
ncbi:MAG TPA: nucleotidyl transferase AbiEii/AbiGii toxin family protein [Thermoanaerobaculia bacterium]|nr:nucleotidyl transferase AbiEii/AbiGii toxin family protein [Thermoanaerobaculia bacterium]